MNRVDNDNKFAIIEVGCKVKARRTQIEHFDLGSIRELRAKYLYRERAKSIVSEKDIA
jgi:hypothetical protein